MALLHRVAHRAGASSWVRSAATKLAAELRGERAQALLAAGDEHEAGAVVAGEQAGGRLADAARGTGDDDDGGGVGHPRQCARNGGPPRPWRGGPWRVPD